MAKLQTADLRMMPCEGCSLEGVHNSKCDLVLAARCHPHAGTKVVYRKGDHCLEITCQECRKMVVELILNDPKTVSSESVN